MKINYEATSAYYPGMQRFRLLSDPVLRQCFLIMALFGAATFLLRFFFWPYPQFETITGSLLFLLPALIQLAGGASRKGWVWYAGFCVLSLLGFNLVEILDSQWLILLLVPALGCLFGLHRAAPHLAEAMGYKQRVSSVREVFFIIVFSALIVVTYYFGGLVAKIGFRATDAGHFALYFAQGFVQYLAFTGLIYGILVRRLVRLKIPNMLIIGICVIMIQLLWLQGYLITGIPLPVVFIGNLSGAVFVQMTVLFAFFLCQSTRMALVMHIAFFVMDCLKYTMR